MRPVPRFPELVSNSRFRLLEAMGDDEAMVLFGASCTLRNGDSEYRFRQRSDVLYLTGWEEPDVVVWFAPGSEHPFQMFVQPRDPDVEVWTGRRAGVEGAVNSFGADLAYPISELEERLPELLLGVECLYFDQGSSPAHDALVHKARKQAYRRSRRTFEPTPDSFRSTDVLLRELRVQKTPAELDVLREAVNITGAAHRAAMQATRPGMMEYELEALIDYTFRSRGGNGPGYTTIVGAGANACILHYVAARGKLESGELVLVDAGCEYGWYTADVTRTWPVDGRFEGAGRDVYQVVLDANRASLDTARIGRCFNELQEVAIRVLTQGLLDLGILQGDLDGLIEDKAYSRYYMHNIGHWLGLDVHDVGLYHRDGESRSLEPGMVLTVEPGLYLSADDEDLPVAFRGIGVRIEDDVLITEKGPDILTREIPVTIENIEACMADSG